MRSAHLSILMSAISLALVGTAPSVANAQRMHALPSAMAPMALHPTTMATPTRTNNFVLGVQPSASVNPVTVFPINRNGTISPVGLSTTVRIPTNASGFPIFGGRNDAFSNAARLTSIESLYHLNPLAVGGPEAYYSSLFRYNPYLSNYGNAYMMGYGSPYMMGYGGYGGYGGGGYAGAYGGYNSPSMSAYATNPYTNYTAAAPAVAPPVNVPVANPANVPAALNPIAEVGIYDNRFEPVSITVSPGTTVRWTNYGDKKQSVTSDAGLFDSQDMATRSVTSYTFTQPGRYTYRSAAQNGMQATVVVK